MIQAVARALKAGIKADYTLVLEGAQGLRKSMTFSVLGGEFYTDDLASFATKDASQGVAGAWIIELPELVRLRGANVNMIKSFLSRNVDRFRPPYGKHTIEAPRSNVFCGTTNDDQYLLDVTGNRRFWPVRVLEPANIDGLHRDRDQLWAEAVHYFEKGEQYWVEQGSELELALAGEQEIRIAEDELEGPVISWVSIQVANEFARKQDAQSVGAPTDKIHLYVTMFEIYRFGLGLDATGAAGLSRVRDLGPRIGRILRKHGWRRYNRGTRGSREYHYHPPEGWDWEAVLKKPARAEE
jgi:predicted P-loop ATPase